MIHMLESAMQEDMATRVAPVRAFNRFYTNVIGVLRAGFELADEEKHHSFGHDLVGQNWARHL